MSIQVHALSAPVNNGIQNAARAAQAQVKVLRRDNGLQSEATEQ